jgi:hypothetical protein
VRHSAPRQGSRFGCLSANNYFLFPYAAFRTMPRRVCK